MKTLLKHAPWLLSLCALGAQAQPANDGPLTAAQRHAIEAAATTRAAAALAAAQAQIAAMDVEGNLAFLRSELFQERQVKGAPYCAEAVHETVQPLGDGNRIVHSQRTRLCRDGEGRTRQEVERSGRHNIFIHDPVARESWVLDVERKTARRVPMGPGQRRIMISQDTPAWREYAQRMREWSQKVRERVRQDLGREDVAPPLPPVPPVPPAPPEPVLITQTEKISRDAQGKEKRVVVMNVNGSATVDAAAATPALPPLPPIPPLDVPQAVALRAADFAPRGAGAVTPLGSKELEGMKVNGERTSWTIEAGKVGNEKPFTITRDVWTSPELGVTVATRDFDPRSGEVNYRLQNLKRGEPDAALMKVPADYVVTAPGN